jgi:hypothetical protein
LRGGTINVELAVGAHSIHHPSISRSAFQFGITKRGRSRWMSPTDGIPQPSKTSI